MPACFSSSSSILTDKLIFLTGPTACGKTRRAVELASALGNTEIVSADSRQVYRGMDLGTGKDLDEYGSVPFHLIDVCDAGSKYNLFEYLRDANAAIDSIGSRGKRALVCGGTGLYVESLANGLQLPQVPQNPGLRASLHGLGLEELTRRLAAMKPLHNTTDVDTPARAIRAIEIQTYYQAHPEAARHTEPHPRPDNVIIALDISRDERRHRISLRLHERLRAGMVEEVERLLASGIAPDDLIYYGLEYKYLTLYVTGRLSRQEMESGLETAIHQFAKRQMTWFRGMERRGHRIHWLAFDAPDFLDRALELAR